MHLLRCNYTGIHMALIFKTDALYTLTPLLTKGGGRGDIYKILKRRKSKSLSSKQRDPWKWRHAWDSMKAAGDFIIAVCK